MLTIRENKFYVIRWSKECYGVIRIFGKRGRRLVAAFNMRTGKTRYYPLSQFAAAVRPEK